MNKQITVKSLAIEAANFDANDSCDGEPSDVVATLSDLHDQAVEAWRALCSSTHAVVVEGAREEFIAAYVEARA